MLGEAKKRKTSEDNHDDQQHEQYETLIDTVSDSLRRLSLQKQSDAIVSSLIDKDITSTSSSLIALGDDSNRLASLQGMQLENIIILKVGGKFFSTTMKTLMGERGKKAKEGDEQEEMQDDEKTENNNDIEYIVAQPNLFKVMFDSGVGIARVDEGNKSAISFPDRNPDYFEYILEHLRQGGKVKSLGIEKLNINDLENILEESRYFATEKLSEYILFLLDKYHKYHDLNLEIYSEFEQALEKRDFQKIEFPIVEKVQQRNQIVEDSINEMKRAAAEKSRQLVEKYQNFVTGTDLDTDLSVKLDISGQVFHIPFSVLRKHKDFLISQYILSPHFCLNENGCIFIDRSYFTFSLIHGYLISGKFNHFPKNLSLEKKHQLKQEAEFYGLPTLIKEYLDPLRYPVEKIGKDNIELKEKEDRLREIFANDRDSPLLEDPYLLLSPLFQNLNEIKNQEKFRIDAGACPKLLDLSDKTRYSRQVSKPQLVDHLNTFKLNWHRFTQGALKGLDWNNIFAAGGGVLACCLKNDTCDNNSIIISNERVRSSSKKQSLIDDNDDNDVSDFSFWRKFKKTNRESEIEQTNQEISYPFDQFISEGFRVGDFSTDARTFSRVKQNFSSTVIPNENANFIPDPNIPASFKNSDIDLFLYALSEEEAEEKIKHIYQTIKKNMSTRIIKKCIGNEMLESENYTNSSNGDILKLPEAINDDVLVVRTKFAVTFYCYKLRPIQVILRIYKSPAEILLGFDIDCATMGYDGSQVWSSGRARRSLMYHTNLVDVDRQSTTYEYRLYKYAKRGFSVSIPGYDTSKVQNQLLQYPRRYSFTSTEYLLHGLARLIAFDNSCRAKNPRIVLGIYDNVEKAQSREENKALILSGELNVKSDYLDLNIIKSQKYPPIVLFESLEKHRKVVANINLKEDNTDPERLSPRIEFDSRIFEKDIENIIRRKNTDWKPQFIYTLNDIDTILDNQSIESRLSKKVEFLTIDPGTQRIGSFHPKDINFYRDAYQPSPLYKLPLYFINETETGVVWLKSMNSFPPQHVIELSKTKNQPNNLFYERYKKINIRTLKPPQHKEKKTKSSRFAKYEYKEVWFETFTPEKSNIIEKEYRKYSISRNPERFELSPSEMIDFSAKTLFCDVNHPTHPNSFAFLERDTFYNGNNSSEDNPIISELSSNSFY